jgi:hypothetical protein
MQNDSSKIPEVFLLISRTFNGNNLDITIMTGADPGFE